MSYEAYEEAGLPAILNDGTKTAAGLVARVYEFSGMGGNAHVVVDDWNLNDESIRWCLDIALEKNAHGADAEQIEAELACLEALLALSLEERASALALHEGFIDEQSIG